MPSPQHALAEQRVGGPREHAAEQRDLADADGAGEHAQRIAVAQLHRDADQRERDAEHALPRQRLAQEQRAAEQRRRRESAP